MLFERDTTTGTGILVTSVSAPKNWSYDMEVNQNNKSGASASITEAFLETFQASDNMTNDLNQSVSEVQNETIEPISHDYHVVIPAKGDSIYSGTFTPPPSGVSSLLLVGLQVFVGYIMIIPVLTILQERFKEKVLIKITFFKEDTNIKTSLESEKHKYYLLLLYLIKEFRLKDLEAFDIKKNIYNYTDHQCKTFLKHIGCYCFYVVKTKEAQQLLCFFCFYYVKTITIIENNKTFSALASQILSLTNIIITTINFSKLLPSLLSDNFCNLKNLTE